VTEIVENPDPLVMRAFRSRGFLSSASAVIGALHLEDTVLTGIRDQFVLLVDEEGIWVCPEDAAGPPHIRIQWSMVGTLRDSWDSTTGVGAIVGDLIVGLVTGLGGSLAGTNHPTLCVPVLAKSGTVELKVQIDSLDGIAREAERRRPKRRTGKMLPWIPDET
jgi:hypothetical protein